MQPGSALSREHDLRRTSYFVLVAGCILLGVAAIKGITDNPPAVTSMFLGLFALVLGVAFFFAKSGERKPAYQWLYWAPRALCIAFIAFLSMFALDVFGEAHGFWLTLLALTMHLIPSFILAAILALAWRWEWIGAALFAAAGMLFLVMPPRAAHAPTLATFLLIAGPAFLIAALFLANWLKRGEVHTTRAQAAKRF